MPLGTLLLGLIAGPPAPPTPKAPVGVQLLSNMRTGLLDGMRRLEHLVIRQSLDEYLSEGALMSYLMPGVELTATLAPTYGFLPPSPYRGVKWEVWTAEVDGVASVVMCAQAAINPRQEAVSGFALAATQMPRARTWLSTACADGEVLAPSDDLSGYPSLALNYAVSVGELEAYVIAQTGTPEVSTPGAAPGAVTVPVALPDAATRPGKKAPLVFDKQRGRP